MNFVKSIKLSLKYHRFTPSGFKLQDLENLSLRQKLNSFLPDRINPGHIRQTKAKPAKYGYSIYKCIHIKI